MALTDTAEYWNDIKIRSTYMGEHFRHNPNHKCSHYNPRSGNTQTTIYIGDINCHECIKNMNADELLKAGLKEGKAPETFYMSKRQKKAFNQQKAFDELHGKCECGSVWVIRTNKKNQQQFLGCSKYPNCNKTKQINE